MGRAFRLRRSIVPNWIPSQHIDFAFCPKINTSQNEVFHSSVYEYRPQDLWTVNVRRHEAFHKVKSVKYTVNQSSIATTKSPSIYPQSWTLQNVGTATRSTQAVFSCFRAATRTIVRKSRYSTYTRLSHSGFTKKFTKYLFGVWTKRKQIHSGSPLYAH